MAWIFLIIAGIAEISGVSFMKLSNGFTRLKSSIGVLLSAGLSFYFLSLALLTIPIGTAYAIWTGIGAAGSVIVGMLFFRESRNPKRILFIGCILIGVIGLRLTGNVH